ncbi:DUF58 domain-containing protein [Candidatus Micrarchaeota archaeon]|nr:DUF58 domain-containing protein [Candidatus Micrarchaeota archaeon]
MGMKLDLEQRIKSLEIVAKRLVTSNFMGNYKSVFKGRGIEFDSYRTYTPADDATLIDWLASQKGGELLVKQYVEERNLDVFFLVDSSRSMEFGSHEKLKHEYTAELVASLSFEILTNGDGVGLGMFNEKMNVFIPPKIGLSQYYIVIRKLTDLNNYGKQCSLLPALVYLNMLLRKSALIIIVSDFIGVGNDWERYIKIMAKKYEMIAFVVRDPRDNALPSGVGQMVLSDPYSNAQLLVDVDKISESYERHAREMLQATRGKLINSGVDVVELNSDESFVLPVIKFFERRKRRWR